MFTSRSPQDTFAAGAKCAREAQRGDVFALTGDLGAGKTQFVKGFVAGIQSPVEVTSPTFVLLDEDGGGRLPVYHFVFYRIENREALLRLGFDDYVFGDGVSLIEWADRYRDIIPRHAQWLSFQMRDENVREIEGITPR